jgi:hypothetical protein
MPPLRFLVLHGFGSNSDVTTIQLQPLLRALMAQNLVDDFEHMQGTIDTPRGPGVGDFFEGPFYSYYHWPPTPSEKHELSIQDAYDDLDAHLEDDGPYDGVIGFSHGGTLLAGYLADLTTRQPTEELPVRCAVFLCSFPPFRMDEKEKPQWRLEGMEFLQRLPSLHLVGAQDWAYEHSVRLFGHAAPDRAVLVKHKKGHEVPGDTETVGQMVTAFKDLHMKVAFGF